MNEIFSFRKELNFKKIIVFLLLITILICITIWKTYNFINQKKAAELEAANPNAIFYDENKSISLELSKKYKFIQYKPTNNYLLELRNENNLNIFISKENLLENQKFSEVVSADMKSYIKEFNQTSDFSSIKEFIINNSVAYTYSFQYLDQNTKVAYYLQNVWIQHNDKYYIIDIEFPLAKLNDNTQIINDVLYSLVIY